MPPIIKITDQNELISSKTYPLASWSFEKFNPVQSRIFDLYTEDANILISARTSAGKAQPDDALVLTNHGYVRIDSLNVGDFVIGSDGKPTKIIGIYPQGVKQIFEVVFSDNTKTECCADHLWAVKSEKDIENGNNWKVIPVSKIKEERNGKYHIPCVNNIDFPNRSFLIHPYVMGIILGNTGGVYGTKVTIFDNEVLQKFQKLLPHGNKLILEKNCDYLIVGEGEWNPIAYDLSQLGILGLKSYEKFIPWIYKYCSIEQRKELICGLMDSNGLCNSDKIPNFDTTSKNLAEDMAFLIRSMGGYTKIKRKINFNYNYNYNDKSKDERKYRRPFFRMKINLYFNPFSDYTKKSFFYKNKIKNPLRKIIDVIPKEEKKCRCIKVENQDGLYITNDFIVTHNTVAAEMFLAHEIRKRGGKGMFLAPLRALAQEKIDQWTDSEYHFKDLKISICTGDYRITPDRQKELNNSNLIIMTSEMLNHRARNMASEKSSYLKDIGTLVIDESHLLTVPSRGEHLEVGLMKFTEINPNCRIVLLSATMPNVNQIAEWLSYSLNKKKTYALNSEYRPVPLGVHYEIYDDYARNYDGVERSKIEKAMDIVNDYPDDKFLIFAHTKRTGEQMKNALQADGIKAEFHNADLVKEDRISLERRFKEKDGIRAIVATPTLAWGCYAEGTNILLANNTIKKIENICVGDFVYSMTNDGFVGKKVLKIAPKNPQYSYKVILSSGEEAIVSPDHKFFGAIGREVPDYNIVSSYKNGDLLAVPNPIDGNNVIADDFGYICGYFCGDGCKTLVGKYANGDDKFVIDIAFGSSELIHLNYMKFLFSKVIGYDFKSEKIDSNGVYHLITKKQSVVQNFDFFKSGRNKNSLSLFDFPRQDPQFIKGVLQGLFDSDGGFSYHCKSYVSIEFSTISKNLANEVQQYLLMFGVRASVSKKMMKGNFINGRIQLARKDYIYRVRIYGDQVDNFVKFIGFRIESKSRYGEYILNNHEIKDNKRKNILPVRKLLLEHAKANNITSKELADIIGIDLWNSINKQDLKFETCKKIIEKYPNESPLTELLSKNIRFSKIKSIEKIEAVNMYDIEVEDTHNYVGNGIISHNCNLPARRVIILGVHRGIQEVETYNITQMVGRSGRLGIDVAGDAYILVPESQEEIWRKKLQKPQKIESQLLRQEGENYKVLAFHLVSEIHHGCIKNNEDVYRWYERSLAYFQNKNLHQSVVDDTLELLKDRGCLKFEDNMWKITSVGSIASMFYFHPLDVADLKNNFWRLFKNNQQDNDYCLAMALANIDTNRYGIVSRLEKEEMSLFANRVKNIVKNYNYTDSVIKAGYCYFNLLSGNNSANLASVQRNFQFDYPRVSQVLLAIDSMSGKWDQSDYFYTLEDRIRSGVPAHLVNLCRIPNIGKVRAKKLYDSGIKSVEEFSKIPEDKLRKIINMKEDIIKSMLNEANKLLLISSQITNSIQ